MKVSAFQEGKEGGDAKPEEQKKDLAEIKEEFKVYNDSLTVFDKIFLE